MILPGILRVRSCGLTIHSLLCLSSSKKAESLEASDNLPDPDVIAQEIMEDLEAALEQFREIVGDFDSKNSG